MMELLTSNYHPLTTRHKTFYDMFYYALSKAALLRIGVGFITQDSLAELLQAVKLNRKPKIELVIGMHHFLGFEKPQLMASLNLNSFLVKENLGGVYVSTQFPYHGKAYSFSNSLGEVFAGIIGSNNLGSIVRSTNRIYESAIYVDDEKIINDLDLLIQRLISCSQPIDGLDTKIINSSAPLDNIPEVEKIDSGELTKYASMATNIRFSIPLKVAPGCTKSNLNVYFGKGRCNTHSEIIIPRPWYEIELIVPSNITNKPNYPLRNINGGIFSVITDDGWKFKCKVSGDYSKNLRSEGNLSILGRWIKGRLENEGLLTPGEIITETMLKKYGRNTVDLIKTKETGVWLLMFESVKKGKLNVS